MSLEKVKSLEHIKERIDIMEVGESVFDMTLGRDAYTIQFFVYLSLVPNFDRDNETRRYFYGKVFILGPIMLKLREMDKDTLLWLLREINDTHCEMLAFIEEWMDGRETWILT